jgi:endonuclease/exonuclease/phosphatase family metal-dependent hydrolase
VSGQLLEDLKAGDDQAKRVAAIIQRVRPSVLLINEFDYDEEGRAATRFLQDYLGVPQHGGTPIGYEHVFLGPVNTGEPAGMDLDRDGRDDGPGDAFGFGQHPGQYGMLLLSQFPILSSRTRTFRLLPWRAMPDNALPFDFYGPEAAAVLRLSSKSHWDVPVRLPDGRVLHLLASHPTPPVFDGPEDRNGRRNFDEIRFWADYLDPRSSGWIVDDTGTRGGIAEGEPFVVLGDLNADPFDGDSSENAMASLIEHPRIAASAAPASDGAVVSARRSGGVNVEHRGNPMFDTVELDPDGPGNLRLDYVLPSVELELLAGGVFWPPPEVPDSELVGASDHRLVWIDVR